MGSPKQSKKKHLARSRKRNSILTKLKKSVVPETPKSNDFQHLKVINFILKGVT
jgi:hypothetical protein